VAKKRGFELTPLNLIVLLLALAFVMQTCSPAAPDYDDLPPFPPAPGSSGEAVFGNLLSGFQTGTATVVPKAISITPSTATSGQSATFSISVAPADKEIWAVYRTVYIKGVATPVKVDNNFPRKTADYIIIDATNYPKATTSLT